MNKQPCVCDKRTTLMYTFWRHNEPHSVIVRSPVAEKWGRRPGDSPRPVRRSGWKYWIVPGHLLDIKLLSQGCFAVVLFFFSNCNKQSPVLFSSYVSYNHTHSASISKLCHLQTKILKGMKKNQFFLCKWIEASRSAVVFSLLFICPFVQHSLGPAPVCTFYFYL